MTSVSYITHDAPSLHCPRILCLHGGGTNARIFRAQCRIISRYLEGTFRLVFAEAPFLSKAGPDVLSVYKAHGPFKCWLPWSATSPADINPFFAVDMLDDSLTAAMEEDDRAGATGPWVGLLGFSQGAKICASLLYRQQRLLEQFGPTHPGVMQWRFAILLAGRGPLINLDPGLAMAEEAVSQVLTSSVLYLPTVHVHGTLDPGLHEHQKLFDRWCAEGTAQLMEWEGHHRVPIKRKDVIPLVAHILRVAYETGSLSGESDLKEPFVTVANPFVSSVAV
ncbi:serine hydrolase FSH [Aspergillus crustosus]